MGINNNDFFATLVLGHLMGDYLFQNKWMAYKKSGDTWVCFVHCLIYTIVVTATTLPSIQNWQWPLLVFLTHFPVDRWGLADRWLALIDSRTLKDFMYNGRNNIPDGYDRANYHALRGGFTVLVYAIADNTIHLTMMYYGAKLLWE
jgi:hypothetical protein